MDPLSAAASVIAVLQLSEAVLGSCYRFVGKAKGAESDINLVILQVGYLTTILRDLKTRTEPNATSPDTASDSLESLTGDNGPLALCARGLEEIKSKLPGGPVTLRQRLQWPFESKKINEIMSKIMSQIPILELAVAGSSHGVVTEIQDSLDDMKRREGRDKVLTWLRSVDPTVKHLRSRQLHQPGSNNWILESDHFKEWRDNSGTLWLHSIPGAGKTSEYPMPVPMGFWLIAPVLCSTIIDHVEELCKTKPEARLAYYYFDFSDMDIQELGTLLRCLIWQLCNHEETLPQTAQVLYESYDNGRRQPSIQVLADTLFGLLSHNPDRRDYIIIDALDECPIESRERFYELFLDRIDRQKGSFNFLFTSRREPDIEQRMTELSNLYNVPIFTGDVDADVRLHVSRFISNHRTMKDWSNDLKSEVENAISGGAEGM
jgi:hypothetical protein